MNDNIVPLLATAKIFRSASGELWTLDDDQIEKIPYLAALVSSAEKFESTRDEHGFYKLDPSIQSKHFTFVLNSLSFQSVRQIFPHLPKQNDIIPIIALFDFLGIAPQPDPTFEEIDAVFFSNLLYKPSANAYLHIVRPYKIQDMAVRFAFALAKEEYNFNNGDVVDQIYWFVMFIQSAYELFGPRLRHHVYRIAEHCFTLFSPVLLKPLQGLLQRTEKGTMTVLSSIDEDLCFYEEEEEQQQSLSHENIYLNYIERPIILQKSEPEHPLLFDFYWLYPNHFYRRWRPLPNEDDLLKPVRRIVVDTIYECLQHELCKSLMVAVRQCQFPYVKKRTYKSILLNILEHERVQEEINEKISIELRKLKPKIQTTHNELVIKLRKYEERLPPVNVMIHPWHLFFIYNTDLAQFEQCQSETLVYALLLEKLHQCAPMIKQIRQDVLKAIYKAAQKQIKDWEKTYQEIIDLQENADIPIKDLN
jgi:hypothetical protein